MSSDTADDSADNSPPAHRSLSFREDAEDDQKPRRSPLKSTHEPIHRKEAAGTESRKEEVAGTKSGKKEAARNKSLKKLAARTKSRKKGAQNAGDCTQSHEKSIKRSHLLAALRTLRTDLEDPLRKVDPLKEKLKIGLKTELSLYKRSCSLDPCTDRSISWNSVTPKSRLLTYTLTQSIFRHDWSTAARCLQMMLDMERCTPFIYRTLLIVLFNHPRTNSGIIQNFLKRVLNLKTRSLQLRFLQQVFLLPHDMDMYVRRDQILSEQDGDMAISEDDDEN